MLSRICICGKLPTGRHHTTMHNEPGLAGKLSRQPVWSDWYVVVRDGPQSPYHNLKSELDLGAMQLHLLRQADSPNGILLSSTASANTRACKTPSMRASTHALYRTTAPSL